MKIQQLNNIRKKSFITIYASLKKKKTLISRYGKEFNIFNMTNNSGNLEVLLHPTNTSNMIKTYILNRKVARLKLRVKSVKYIHPTKHLKSSNIQKLRSSFKVNCNAYTLIGIK